MVPRVEAVVREDTLINHILYECSCVGQESVHLAMGRMSVLDAACRLCMLNQHFIA